MVGLMAESKNNISEYCVTIFGSTRDHNVQLIEEGFHTVMKDSNINVIYSINTVNWLAEEAYYAINEALLITSEIDGVFVVMITATEAIRALSENRMAGEVVVAGQDANCCLPRIVEGTQTVTYISG